MGSSSTYLKIRGIVVSTWTYHHGHLHFNLADDLALSDGNFINTRIYEEVQYLRTMHSTHIYTYIYIHSTHSIYTHIYIYFQRPRLSVGPTTGDEYHSPCGGPDRWSQHALMKVMGRLDQSFNLCSECQLQFQELDFMSWDKLLHHCTLRN